jgi:hypothetical protein
MESEGVAWVSLKKENDQQKRFQNKLPSCCVAIKSRDEIGRKRWKICIIISYHIFLLGNDTVENDTDNEKSIHQNKTIRSKICRYRSITVPRGTHCIHRDLSKGLKIESRTYLQKGFFGSWVKNLSLVKYVVNRR